MKKSLGEILKVSSVFKTLMNKRYNNFSLSYKIARASKELDEHNNFYSEEERKIVEHYAVKDEKTGQIKIVNGNQIQFKDKEDAIKFNEEIMKLQKTEVDIFDVIQININDFKQGEMDLTPSDILNLDGFVNFIDETNDEALN